MEQTELFTPNTIYCGDNLDIMRNIPDESVDLIYLDPPFFSNRQYGVIWGMTTRLGALTTDGKEV